jgi:hypothetical protein
MTLFSSENKTIKVQLIGHATVKSLIESGVASTDDPLTFHAYSDQMKARILDSFLNPLNRGKIALSFTDDLKKDGEWHEKLSDEAIVNQ